MTLLDLAAAVVLIAVVLGAASAGLCAHLLWLALTDWRELGEVLGLMTEVIGV